MILRLLKLKRFETSINHDVVTKREVLSDINMLASRSHDKLRCKIDVFPIALEFEMM